MKDLIKFIKESLQINEETLDIWNKKDPKALDILYGIKSFFNSLKGNIYSLDNKTEVKNLYNTFKGSDKHPSRYLNYSYKMIVDYLNKYNLGTPEKFRGFILSNHDNFVKNKIYIDWVKQWNETEAEKEYKKAKEKGEIPDSIEDDDAEDRDLVIYDRWNPEIHSVYSFTGKRGKSTDHQVNMIRMDFKYSEGVKYYDCYPILAKNYYGHVEDLKKRAELQIGYEDPNEFK